MSRDYLDPGQRGKDHSVPAESGGFVNSATMPLKALGVPSDAWAGSKRGYSGPGPDLVKANVHDSPGSIGPTLPQNSKPSTSSSAGEP